MRGTSPGQRRAAVRTQAFSIDHRHHMNLAYERQQVEDDLLSRVEADMARESSVVEVKNLRHLERLLEATGGRVVVLSFFSRSCGICKDVRRELDKLSRESHHQRAGIVFLCADTLDDYDWPSDLARYFNIQVRNVLSVERRKLHTRLRELLWKNAPSARR